MSVPGWRGRYRRRHADERCRYIDIYFKSGRCGAGTRTIVSAAFLARRVGFGRSTRGAGGGRAAVCGEAASGLRGVLVLGMTTGGESWSGGSEIALGAGADAGAGALRPDQADIMARRDGGSEGRDGGRWCARRWRRAREAIVEDGRAEQSSSGPELTCTGRASMTHLFAAVAPAWWRTPPAPPKPIAVRRLRIDAL